MNSVIHAALCRDLDRTAVVLDRPEDLSPERLRAVGEHAVWLMDFLHDHHTTEDTQLFPLLRTSSPDAGPLLDAMDAEHHAISEAVTEFKAAGRDAAAGEAGAAERLRDALAVLRTVLDPHLDHEERDVPAVITGHVSEEDWAAFEKSNIEGKRPPELAFQGHWMLDNLEPAGAAVVRSKVPAVPRFIMLRLLGGAYRRRRAELWGGTPAEGVPSRPRTPL
jgi:hemerythrin-like domain-containing protein